MNTVIVAMDELAALGAFVQAGYGIQFWEGEAALAVDPCFSFDFFLLLHVDGPQLNDLVIGS